MSCLRSLLQAPIRYLSCSTPTAVSRVKIPKQDLPVRVSKDTFIVPKRVLSPSIQVEHVHAAAPSSDKSKLFAVCGLGGKQYKVIPGNLIMTPRLKQIDIGEKLKIESVLLVGGVDFTVIGQPHVENFTILASVQEQTQTSKIIVFKKKRRQGYRRTRGHRTDVTIIKIDNIEFGLNATDSIAAVASE